MRPYVVGTACGMLPGIVVAALFADRLRYAVREPGFGSFAVLAIACAALLAIGWWLRRYYTRVGETVAMRTISRGDMEFGARPRPTVRAESA